ncbi:hypothetical protein SynPROS91_02323 [Synechococcus sp. PROS-9-1]|nr:hypothetical protein SynPROS91_02323 [Synechococcus sp. PROS-9-1]
MSTRIQAKELKKIIRRMMGFKFSSMLPLTQLVIPTEWFD